MEINEYDEFLEHLLFRLQWHKFTPRHNRKPSTSGKNHLSEPIFEDYREGRITKGDICRHLGIHEKDLFRTLVEKGELFG